MSETIEATPVVVEPPPGSRRAALIVSAILGATIWGASPFLVGEAEPWDAEPGLRFFYYPTALLLAGFVSGLAARRRAGTAYWGLIIGQLAFMFAFLPMGPLMILGLGYLAVYTSLSILGVWLAELAMVLGARSRVP